MTRFHSGSASQILSEARMVANYAKSIGLSNVKIVNRDPAYHLGAALADAILQAGVNYETVVRMRVERIQTLYPCSSHMQGLRTTLSDNGLSDYLLWKHETKINRFSSLTNLVDNAGIKSTGDLKIWLCGPCSRREMLSLNGIGPKTYDYISGLVGIDRIAVDRHIVKFVKLAGSSAKNYEDVQKVASFAADLLNVRRRVFDASIWNFVSSRRSKKISIDQIELPFGSVEHDEVSYF